MVSYIFKKSQSIVLPKLYSAVLKQRDKLWLSLQLTVKTRRIFLYNTISTTTIAYKWALTFCSCCKYLWVQGYFSKDRKFEIITTEFSFSSQVQIHVIGNRKNSVSLHLHTQVSRQPKRCHSAMLDPKGGAFYYVSGSLQTRSVIDMSTHLRSVIKKKFCYVRYEPRHITNGKNDHNTD